MTAPACLALAMDSLICFALQSKSRAHWFRLQVATFNSLIVPRRKHKQKEGFFFWNGMPISWVTRIVCCWCSENCDARGAFLYMVFVWTNYGVWLWFYDENWKSKGDTLSTCNSIHSLPDPWTGYIVIGLSTRDRLVNCQKLVIPRVTSSIDACLIWRMRMGEAAV